MLCSAGAVGEVVLDYFLCGDDERLDYVVFDNLKSRNVGAHLVNASVVEAEVALSLLLCLGHLLTRGRWLNLTLIHVNIVGLQRRALRRTWVQDLRRIILHETPIVLPLQHLQPPLPFQYRLLPLYFIKLLQRLLCEVYL